MDRVGHYRLERRLGAGGMGEVYLAVDEVLGRRVAVKFLLGSASSASGEQARARFLREARLVASLNHPGIATIYEAGDEGGRLFLAMELVDGRNLAEALDRKPMAADLVRNYALQVAAALEYAHRHGVLHRDLKPANVMIAADGTTKLLDFGLAKAAREEEEEQEATQTALTAPGLFVGTLQYAPPEALEGRASDFRSDIYSFGVMLYEMLTGARPFDGVSAILAGRFEPVRERLPGVDAALAAVAEKAMALRAEDRFADAASLLAALRDGTGEKGAANGRASVAVMEFRNLSGDVSMDWFATGIAETLAADLGRAPAVSVIPRERVQRYVTKSAGAEPAALGAALGARWVVSGSYQRAGERIRITAQLLQVANGEAVPMPKIDGLWADVFELQDRVVRDVTVALDATALAPQLRPATLEIDAYQAYAEGRKALYSFGKDSLETARVHLLRAIELDAEYALAHAALGGTYAMRFIHRTDPSDLGNAVKHLERARELDPDLGEPSAWLCYVYMRQARSEESMRMGRLAVAMQPDFHLSHYFLGAALLFSAEGDADRYLGLAECMRNTIRREPGWEPAYVNLAWVAVNAGLLDDAERLLVHALDNERQGLTTAPFPGVEMILSSVWLRRREWSKAIEWAQAGIDRLTRVDHMYRELFLALNVLGQVEAQLRAGRPQDAYEGCRRALRTAKEFPRMLGNARLQARATACLASACAALGNTDEAMQAAAEAQRRTDELIRSPQSWCWQATLPEISHCLAVARLGLGEAEAAERLLEFSIHHGWRDEFWLLRDPLLMPLAGSASLARLASAAGAAPKPPVGLD